MEMVNEEKRSYHQLYYQRNRERLRIYRLANREKNIAYQRQNQYKYNKMRLKRYCGIPFYSIKKLKYLKNLPKERDSSKKTPEKFQNKVYKIFI